MFERRVARHRADAQHPVIFDEEIEGAHRADVDQHRGLREPVAHRRDQALSAREHAGVGTVRLQGFERFFRRRCSYVFECSWQHVHTVLTARVCVIVDARRMTLREGFLCASQAKTTRRIARARHELGQCDEAYDHPDEARETSPVESRASRLTSHEGADEDEAYGADADRNTAASVR